LFSGTLLLLKEAGCRLHMWNLLDGSCGTLTHSREEIIRIRADEASRSAAVAGAEIHRAIFPDLGVFYDQPSLAAVSAVVRTIRPQIILTHSINDYMEDHQNVCRLITTAAFTRSMPNFSTNPEQPPYTDPARIYHAPPHGLQDGMGGAFRADFLVNVSSTIETKSHMLACHDSQYGWLNDTQGMNSPVEEMRCMCSTIATWGEGLEYAEAWHRHSHIGFCSPDFDPLCNLLGAFYQQHQK
jgi:LmbE family N-acetylglucosaminyl deacetylase